MDYSQPGGGIFYNLFNSPPSTAPSYPDPRAAAYAKMGQPNIPNYPYATPGAPPVSYPPGVTHPYATPGAPPVGPMASPPPSTPSPSLPSIAAQGLTPPSLGGGQASQAFHQAMNTGGMSSMPIPTPPPRPADLGGATDGNSGQDNNNGIPGWSTFAKDFASTPSGSNLAQGPGSPGSGLSSFLGNIFGKQAGQGNVLGNTGGQNPQSIFSGDPQSSLPSWMKGSSIANFLQMLGVGGF